MQPTTVMVDTRRITLLTGELVHHFPATKNALR